MGRFFGDCDDGRCNVGREVEGKVRGWVEEGCERTAELDSQVSSSSLGNAELPVFKCVVLKPHEKIPETSCSEGKLGAAKSTWKLGLTGFLH